MKGLNLVTCVCTNYLFQKTELPADLLHVSQLILALLSTI